MIIHKYSFFELIYSFSRKFAPVRLILKFDLVMEARSFIHGSAAHISANHIIIVVFIYYISIWLLLGLLFELSIVNLELCHIVEAALCGTESRVNSLADSGGIAGGAKVHVVLWHLHLKAILKGAHSLMVLSQPLLEPLRFMEHNARII